MSDIQQGLSPETLKARCGVWDLSWEAGAKQREEPWVEEEPSWGGDDSRTVVSIFLMPQPFYTVPHGVMTPTITLFLLLLHNCDFATVIHACAPLCPWYPQRPEKGGGFP